jgi:hypothetical protein
VKIQPQRQTSPLPSNHWDKVVVEVANEVEAVDANKESNVTVQTEVEAAGVQHTL